MMSNILERTLASIPGLVAYASNSGSASDLRGFVDRVLHANSKQEERRNVFEEIAEVKSRLERTSASLAEKRICLLKMMFCHLLGYDVSFAGIHAINLAQQGNELQKKTGYLLCSLMLQEKQDLTMLLVNTIHKDLHSQKVTEVCIALHSACEFITPELISSFVPVILKKLKDSRPLVRKKSVVCLQVFLSKDPAILDQCCQVLSSLLRDPDPGVMSVAIPLYLNLAKKSPGEYQNLVVPLCEIIGQILDRRLPASFTYRNVPAPWLTISILKLLTVLGAHSPENCVHIYPVIKEILLKKDSSHKIGLAVIFECLQTITNLPPNEELLQYASKSSSKFLSSEDICLRYLGLKSLSGLIKVNPLYVKGHEDAILQCLEHSDTTIRLQTLDLLYSMINHKNALVISTKLTESLKQTKDQFLKTAIMTRLTSIANNFSTNIELFVKITSDVTFESKDSPPKGLRDIVMNCLSNLDSDQKIKYCVQFYWALLDREKLPDLTVEISFWVSCEYSEILQSQFGLGVQDIFNKALVWMRACPSTVTRAEILTCLLHLVPQLDNASHFIEEADSILRPSTWNWQLIQAFRQIKSFHQNMKSTDTQLHCRPIAINEMDFNLSFLDDFVCLALESGAKPYRPASQRVPMNLAEPLVAMKGLSMAAYEVLSGSATSISETAVQPITAQGSSLGPPQFSVSRRVWAKDGYLLKTELSPQQDDRPDEESRERELLKEALFGSLSTTSKDDSTAVSSFTSHANKAPNAPLNRLQDVKCTVVHSDTSSLTGRKCAKTYAQSCDLLDSTKMEPLTDIQDDPKMSSVDTTLEESTDNVEVGQDATGLCGLGRNAQGDWLGGQVDSRVEGMECNGNGTYDGGS